MSEIMIGNGTSLGALQMDIITDNGPENEDTDALLISRGLGFFPEGIVDQHFHARARLARLIIAIMYAQDRYPIGFGVDENTALIYSASDRTIQVAGEGGVTIIDAREADISFFGGLPSVSNLSVSYIEEGDVYKVPEDQIIPSAEKQPVRGHESYSLANSAQAGILSPHGATFLDLVTINLIDNSGADSISNITFTDQSNGFLLTFSKKAISKGFYAESEEGKDRYTVSDIRLDVSPVTVKVTKIQ
jgi:cyanophycinase